jgi:hypothetical protein
MANFKTLHLNNYRQASSIKPLMAEARFVRRGWQELNPYRPSQSDWTPLFFFALRAVKHKDMH